MFDFQSTKSSEAYLCSSSLVIHIITTITIITVIHFIIIIINPQVLNAIYRNAPVGGSRFVKPTSTTFSYIPQNANSRAQLKTKTCKLINSF